MKRCNIVERRFLWKHNQILVFILTLPCKRKNHSTPKSKHQEVHACIGCDYFVTTRYIFTFWCTPSQMFNNTAWAPTAQQVSPIWGSGAAGQEEFAHAHEGQARANIVSARLFQIPTSAPGSVRRLSVCPSSSSFLLPIVFECKLLGTTDIHTYTFACGRRPAFPSPWSCDFS